MKINSLYFFSDSIGLWYFKGFHLFLKWNYLPNHSNGWLSRFKKTTAFSKDTNHHSTINWWRFRNRHKKRLSENHLFTWYCVSSSLLLFKTPIYFRIKHTYWFKTYVYTPIYMYIYIFIYISALGPSCWPSVKDFAF